MNQISIRNISPLDGRYIGKAKDLRDIFSEYAFIRYRVCIEVKYFLFFLEKVENFKFTQNMIYRIKDIYKNFTEHDAFRVKTIENTTNHDVKAIEYFIKEKLDMLNIPELHQYKEYVHFGLTSQDINSVAYVLQMRTYLQEYLVPHLYSFITIIYTLAEKNPIPMLSRTHGQYASPTTLSKELLVFTERINYHLADLVRYDYITKFGGAIGNMNAHYVAYPHLNWGALCDEFLSTFKLKRHILTTQIDNYDAYAVLFDKVRRIQTILIDFCQDIWLYISNDIFILERKEGEIGSSTMPHKVNPIDFENAEGNLLLSNTLLQFLANKLPVSRMQRDLTDSTLLRNLGVAFGHGWIALHSIMKGTTKLKVNRRKLEDDLNKNWIVIFEGIQTILRREKIPNAYEITKKFSAMYPHADKKIIHDFIDALELKEEVKREIKEITPFNYIGRI